MKEKDERDEMKIIANRFLYIDCDSPQATTLSNYTFSHVFVQQPYRTFAEKGCSSPPFLATLTIYPKQILLSESPLSISLNSRFPKTQK